MAVSKYLEEVRREFRPESLWTPEYLEDTPDTAYRFLTECCYTEIESDRTEALIPKKDYIRFIVDEWWSTRKEGRPLIIKKSRRMLVTWISAALDIWDGGLRKGIFYVAAREYLSSARLVWRRKFIYDGLRKRNIFNLPEAEAWLYSGPTAVTRLILPNGSVYEALTGDEPNSFRQEGATRVTCDELAFWSSPVESWSNAITMCKGRAGEPGGHPVAISTVQASEAWRFITQRSGVVSGVCSQGTLPPSLNAFQGTGS